MRRGLLGGWDYDLESVVSRGPGGMFVYEGH